MSKFLRLAFTGIACLGPAYRGQEKVSGPLVAVMPTAHHARFGSDGETQVDAHFVYAAFNAAHLVTPRNKAEKKKYRRADHEVVDERRKKWALCFLDREMLVVDPPPVTEDERKQETEIRYNVSGNRTGLPGKGSTHVEWIARWSQFAAGGNARFKTHALEGKASLVRVVIPGGEVAAGFACPYTPQVRFLYGKELTGYFAHEIVVTLRYKDETETVTLRSTPFDTEPPYRPRDLVLTWGTADVIDLKIGNSSIDEMDNVLRKYCGRQHEGRKDYEFEILYDVVACAPDRNNGGRLPLPEVLTNETRPVPCLATMIDME